MTFTWLAPLMARHSAHRPSEPSLKPETATDRLDGLKQLQIGVTCQAECGFSVDFSTYDMTVGVAITVLSIDWLIRRTRTFNLRVSEPNRIRLVTAPWSFRCRVLGRML